MCVCEQSSAALTVMMAPPFNQEFIMIKRSGSAVWSGGLKDGKGSISTQSGVLDNTQYGFNTRFENGPGTNPEELIGAAHAGCFTMALSGKLGEAGMTATKLQTTATVTPDKTDGALAFRRSIWRWWPPFRGPIRKPSRRQRWKRSSTARCRSCSTLPLRWTRAWKPERALPSFPAQTRETEHFPDGLQRDKRG
jgi:OsmC subfamily peroxiredoxin